MRRGKPIALTPGEASAACACRDDLPDSLTEPEKAAKAVVSR